MNLFELWLPILLAAVGVFAASSIIHMVIRWHRSDYLQLSNEDEVRRALRAGTARPGQYLVPYMTDPKQMGSPEMKQKFEEGPIGFFTLRPTGAPGMGVPLAMWFVFNLVVAIIAAYVASRVMPPGATWGGVARITSAIAFMAYAGGAVQLGIWMGKPWGSVLKEVADAAIYAAVTGAIFGWLWPR